MRDTIRITLKTKYYKSARLKFYSAVAVQYSHATVRRSRLTKIQATEMKFSMSKNNYISANGVSLEITLLEQNHAYFQSKLLDTKEDRGGYVMSRSRNKLNDHKP